MAGRQGADLGGASQHLWYVRVAMPLVFPNPPFVKESESGLVAVWLQGHDTDKENTDKEYHVDCRVIATALTQHCGAGGLGNQELLRAFIEHRARIENTAQRKYAADRVERLKDRIVVWLDRWDF